MGDTFVPIVNGTTLLDGDSQPVSTVSGTNGNKLEVATGLDNLIDEAGRLRAVIDYAPHTHTEDDLSGLDKYTTAEVDAGLDNLYDLVNYNDIIYLTYNGAGGTQHGTSGCTFSGAGTWYVDNLNTMCFLDTSGGPLTVVIPDATQDNQRKIMAFRKPGVLTDRNIASIRTVSQQQLVQADATYDLLLPKDGFELVSTRFGLSGETEYRWRKTYSKTGVANSITVSSYGGDFTTIQAAIDYIKSSASEGEIYTIQVLAGEYTLDSVIDVDTPAITSIIGIDTPSVILKPSSALEATLASGTPFISLKYKTNLSNFTLDATDCASGFNTTGSGVGISLQDSGSEESHISDILIDGFRCSLNAISNTSVSLSDCKFKNCGTGLCVTGAGANVDINYLDLEDCWEYYVHATAGNMAINNSSLHAVSTLSGTAVYTEGTATVVNLGAGTVVDGMNYNLVAAGTSSLLVDGCVIEASNISPGIQQKDTATLKILNTRAPVSYNDLDIDDPTNVYISAYDSSRGRNTIGAGNNTTFTLFSANIGALTNPKLDYVSGDTFDGLSFNNPTDSQDNLFEVVSTNADSKLCSYTVGANAWGSSASLELAGLQNEVSRGWQIEKTTGSTPSLLFKYIGGETAFKLNYNGSVELNTGTSVNKILDDTALAQNDNYALATQKAIKSYVDNYSYSKAELDAGQLDTRYYTKDEVATMSGTFVSTNGATELTGDWDVGNYSITADSFIKGSTVVDLASYSNITGVLSGCSLSINTGDPSLVDVSQGKVVYADMADTENPVVEILDVEATTVDPGITGEITRWLGVTKDIDGSVVITSANNFTQADKRTIAIIGRCWGDGDTTLLGVGNYKDNAYGFGNTVNDLTYALGTVNITGNEYSVGESSMTLKKASGVSLRCGAGHGNNPDSPNVIYSDSIATITNYNYYLTDSAGITSSSGIDPNYYNNVGTKTAVTSDNWTIQSVYYFPGSELTYVKYGAATYATKSLAYDAIYNNPDERTSGLEIMLAGSILRGFLLVKQGATSLTDAEQAEFYDIIDGGIGLPGRSNHGELGGLQDDDHPQYLTTARGDARYYTQTAIDDWREANPLVASGIPYSGTVSDSWNTPNVKDALDEVLEYAGSVLGTGRILPETPLTVSGTTAVIVNAGEGFIVKQASYSHVMWDSSVITMADLVAGSNYVYINTEGVVTISTVELSPNDYIYLGLLFASAFEIGTVVQSGTYLKQSLNGISNYLTRLGVFIYDNGCNVSLLSEGSNRIVSAAGKLQQGFVSSTLTECSSDDALYRFNLAYNTIDMGWGFDFSWAFNEGGVIPIDRYNDTTASGAFVLPYPCQFTHGSTSVVSPGDLTDSLDAGDLVFLANDSYTFMTAVSGVNWTGSITNIDLKYPYPGSSSTYGTIAVKTMKYIPEGKFTKHMVLRDFSDKMFLVYGSNLFDSYDEAYLGDGPEIPDVLVASAFKIAHIIVTPSVPVDAEYSTLNLIDIRPLPFHDKVGGSSTTSLGGGAATDHGNLIGLLDDDHTQYSLTNGQRDFLGVVSYNSHKIFASDTDIVDKKYVDDEISNLTTDHSELLNLNSDDHTQYSLVNGGRNYTDVVSYDTDKTFSEDTDIVAKKYVDDTITSTVITNHSNLTGLSADDHSIYIKADGTRSLSGKLSYTTHPAFSNATEVVDKKYVDDNIASLTTDHSELLNLDADDHTQYLNTTRGDARYYTKGQVDGVNSAHASSSDHDGRYYTENEVDSLITSLSGSLSSLMTIGDIPSAQFSRTSDFIADTSWSSIAFNTTNVETATSVIELDAINTDRINIKRSGYYLINYKLQVITSVTQNVYSRLLKNDSTEVAASLVEIRPYSNEQYLMTQSVITYLQGNDYICLQAVKTTSDTVTMADDTTLSIISLDGIKGEDGAPGEPGPPGTGSTVHVYQDGVPVANNTSILNFEGLTTVTSGVDNTTISFDSTKTIQCYSTITTNVNSITPVPVSWNGQDLVDSDAFTHSTTVNPSRIYVTSNAWYEISYNVYYADASSSSNVRGRIRKNGVTYLGRGVSTAYTRNSTDNAGSIDTGPFLVQLAAGDYVELICDQQGSSTTCNLVANDNYIRLTEFRKI